MSSLSTLLNPAPPNSARGLDSPAGDPSASIHPGTYAQEHESRAVFPAPIDVGAATGPDTNRGHGRRPSLGSPLDTLADVASSSATAYSPTNTKSNAVFGFTSPSSSAARPGSSYLEPPTSIHQSHIHPGHFSPGLEQYHNPTSQEVRTRRLSELSNADSRVLPPLISFRAENPSRYTTQTGQPMPPSEVEGIAGRNTLLQAMSMDPSAEPSIGANNGNQTEAETRLHSSPKASQPAVTLPPTASIDNVSQPEIKSEIAEQLASPVDKTLPVQANNTPSGLNPKAEAAALTTQQDQPISTIEAKRDSVFEMAPAVSPALSAMPKKKKAAPKECLASKKETASVVKPPSKKRKLDNGVAQSSPPPRNKNGTPASSRASKTPNPRNRKQTSETPTRSSSVADPGDGAYGEEEGDEDHSGILYCICRRPDDYTWMIACDGSCDDWYHGKCVGMDERDGSLIDKYICPSCERKGVLETLYKPACRLEGCREPARVNANKPSKYCSDAHGKEFMRHKVLKRPPELSTQEMANSKKRRKSTHDEQLAKAIAASLNDAPAEPTTPLHLRGGLLSASELKTLSTDLEGAAAFKDMGANVLPTPPNTSEGKSNPRGSLVAQKPPDISYTEAEAAHLYTLTVKKEELAHKVKLWAEREKFCLLVRARARAALEELRQRGEQLKDICGYDSCLAWSMPEFESWYNSVEGQAALKFQPGAKIPTSATTKPMVLQKSMLDDQKSASSGKDEGGDPPKANGHPILDGEVPASESKAATSEEDHDDPVLKGVCTKRRCTRHKDWFKYETQGVHFEKDAARREIDKLKREEQELQEKATIRAIEQPIQKNEVPS